MGRTLNESTLTVTQRWILEQVRQGRKLCYIEGRWLLDGRRIHKATVMGLAIRSLLVESPRPSDPALAPVTPSDLAAAS
jgi:hypothetical protein